MSKGRALNKDEIEQILNPPPSGNPGFIIDSAGKKHYMQSGKIPSAVVGSFEGTAGNKRNYKPGDPSVVAYMEGGTNKDEPPKPKEGR